jgi:hypothetical protein
VSSVVGVERLTICAKVLVLGAERATVPLSDDKPRVRVADGLGMLEFTQISCFDVNEQLSLDRSERDN